MINNNYVYYRLFIHDIKHNIYLCISTSKWKCTIASFQTGIINNVKVTTFVILCVILQLNVLNFKQRTSLWLSHNIL